MKLKNSNLEFRIISLVDQIDDFNCGNPSINNYLKQDALYDSLSRTGSTTLVFDGLELVGFVTLSRSSVPQVDTETMIIQYLAVSSTRQVSGVGSKIIEFITEVALSTNENFIFLEALKDDKFELIDWYSRRGFVVADPDELSDNFRHLVWMYINLEDEESLNKMFNEP